MQTKRKRPTTKKDALEELCEQVVLRNAAEPEFHQAVLEVLEFMSRAVCPKSSEGLAVRTVAGALQTKFLKRR